jgi:hypothetical protein
MGNRKIPRDIITDEINGKQGSSFIVHLPDAALVIPRRSNAWYITRPGILISDARGVEKKHTRGQKNQAAEKRVRLLQGIVSQKVCLKNKKGLHLSGRKTTLKKKTRCN